jgi:hypothetical protein
MNKYYNNDTLTEGAFDTPDFESNPEPEEEVKLS